MKLKEVKPRDQVAKADWTIDWKTVNRADQWTLLSSHWRLTEGLGAVIWQEDILERSLC